MVGAAHAVFVERGYGGTRMADIAEAAGVAVQTLYFTFHTKAELLQACYDRAVLGDGEPVHPQQQRWFAEILQAATGRDAVRHFVAGNTAICSRVALLDEVARAAAHEPEALQVRDHSERLRRAGYRKVINHLSKTFGLRDGVTIDQATDLLLLYGSGPIYRTLVIDYRWPEDRYIHWLTDTIATQLLTHPA